MNRNHDMQVSLDGMTQIGMTARLMMNIKTDSEKNFKKFPGSDDRQFWHTCKVYYFTGTEILKLPVSFS